jgi:hypothetical protein
VCLSLLQHWALEADKKEFSEKFDYHSLTLEQGFESPVWPKIQGVYALDGERLALFKQAVDLMHPMDRVIWKVMPKADLYSGWGLFKEPFSQYVVKQGLSVEFYVPSVGLFNAIQDSYFGPHHLEIRPRLQISSFSQMLHTLEQHQRDVLFSCSLSKETPHIHGRFVGRMGNIFHDLYHIERTNQISKDLQEFITTIGLFINTIDAELKKESVSLASYTMEPSLMRADLGEFRTLTHRDMKELLVDFEIIPPLGHGRPIHDPTANVLQYVDTLLMQPYRTRMKEYLIAWDGPNKALYSMLLHRLNEGAGPEIADEPSAPDSE